jgi:peptidoglycan/LPS O-acetylase OafA/YrhL
MHYRADIDGLRAIAIASVVLFHVGLGPFPGGFVGVDIFFVISGYLITGLIVERLRQGKFSFWDFYARRTRRIYPALFAMIPVVLLLGYFMLTPGEYKDLGKSALYSSAFLANVYFWLNTGYFDLSAESMPLLHIWSIAVEEQFYVMWPLTLVLLWRFCPMSRAATLKALIIATVLLAIVCIVWTAHDAKTAFFLPFTRLWEFTLGAGVLALPPIRSARLANALSVLGVIAMICAVLLFSEALAYPGYYAILPCVGTAAAIAAGENSLMSRALSLPPPVFIGKVSYSLYLWHWPFIVYYADYAGTRNFSVPERVSLIAVAVAIAYLSYRFIEQPTRHRRDHPRRHVAYGATIAAAAACLSLLVVFSQGFPGRLPVDIRPLGNYDNMSALSCPQRIALSGLGKTPICVLGAPWETASKHALLWGDSHARHLAPLLDLPAREQDIAVVFLRGCPPFIDNDKVQRNNPARADYTQNCARRRHHILDWVGETPELDLVIIANAWAIYPDALYEGGVFDRADPAKALKQIEKGLNDTVAEIDPNRHSILFIGDVPRPGFVVPDCFVQKAAGLWRKPCAQKLDFFSETDRPLQSILAQLASDKDHIYFVDAVKAMCGQQGCPFRVGEEVIYRDGNHLRQDLSISTRQKLVSMLRLSAALRTATSKTPHAEGPAAQAPAQQ